VNNEYSLAMRIEPNLEAPGLLIAFFKINYVEQSLCVGLYVVILAMQLDRTHSETTPIRNTNVIR